MLGIAIIGGKGPPSKALKEIALRADVLVAADSGLIAAEEAGLTPDWIVGDMDSLKEASADDLARLDKYPQDRVLRYPEDKDHTDTELALSLLREQGCDEIWLLGGGSDGTRENNRIDHIFALRSLFERPSPPARWYTANEEIHCLEEGKTLTAIRTPGSPVSVFPLYAGLHPCGQGPGGLWQAESTGLKWPLDGLVWKIGDYGLSNVTLSNSFSIRSIKGRFLVIM